MRALVRSSLARSRTLKAKQEERKTKRTVIVYKKKSKIREKKIYQDLDGLWKSLEKNFCVIVRIGVRDVD